jgi:sulfur-carrier protein
MKVLIPSPLFSYTNGKKDVEANGSTLAEVLADLDRQFPGLRFRIVDEQDQMRPHMRFFVNYEQTFDLKLTLEPTDSIQIVQALSGG